MKKYQKLLEDWTKYMFIYKIPDLSTLYLSVCFIIKVGHVVWLIFLIQ